MLFSFCLDQFLQDLIKQADAVLVRFELYGVVVTHSFPVREVMGNPSPCATIRNHSVRSGKSKKKTRLRTYDLYDIFCALLYLLKECSLVMSLGYDFFIFFISIFSIIAPILDNENMLHKLLFNMAKFSNFVIHH